jgi:hypothetical protein
MFNVKWMLLPPLYAVLNSGQVTWSRYEIHATEFDGEMFLDHIEIFKGIPIVMEEIWWQ